MLASDQIELLTAYVDGELSPRRRQVALRLLSESSEARTLLKELQENAHRVRQLPRRTLDAAFTAQVVQAAAKKPIEPARPARPVSAGLRWLPYVFAGVAAAVLFMVVTAAVLSVGLGLNWLGVDNGENAIVENKDGGQIEAPPKPAPVDEGDKIAPPKKPSNPLPGKIIEGVLAQYAAPIPRERFASLTFQELHEHEDARKRLAAELEKNNSLHLDVVVRNNPHAIERLKKALKPLGAKLVVDPTSEAALKTGGKTEFLVYAENLKAEELANLMKQLAAEEKKAKTPYDKLKVSSMSKQERQNLVAFLGEDPDKRKVVNNTGIIGPRPKPNPKAERVLVVLPQQASPKHSQEMKQFLLQPAYPQPGAVSVLIRIRQE